MDPGVTTVLLSEPTSAQVTNNLGTGTGAGTAVAGGVQFCCQDAFLEDLDWFETLTGWFPEDLGQGGSNCPNQQVVDAAYSSPGGIDFFNVQVPSAGYYNIDYRYAFQGGLFPAQNNRSMSLWVNGNVVAEHMRFPITGSFGTFEDSVLQEKLNSGVNDIRLTAPNPIGDGISRADQLTVTTMTCSSPSP